MSILSRILHREEPYTDPIDQRPPLAETFAPRVAWVPRAKVLHKHHDGFGDPLHDWVEKRLQAIEATCKECGAVELHSDHPGTLKGQKVGRRTPGQKPTGVGVKGKPWSGTAPERTKRNEEWKSYYEGGMTADAIGAVYGVSGSAVLQGLHRMGVQMRPKGPAPKPPKPKPPKAPRTNKPRTPEDPARTAEIIRLRVEEHWTYEAIGRRYDISRERVRQLLKLAGVDLHAQVEARLDVVAKRRQPKPPSVCRYCGQEYTGPYNTHAKAARSVANHSPNPNAAFYAERDKLIAADYSAGMKVDDIEAKYGVAASTIQRAIKDCGVPKRRPNGNFLKTKAESAARKAAMTADIKSGMTEDEVATKYNVSGAWVYLVAREAGVVIRTPRPTQEERAEMAAEYQRGVSVKELVKRYKRSDSLIYRAIHDAGVPLRGHA